VNWPVLATWAAVLVGAGCVGTLWAGAAWRAWRGDGADAGEFDPWYALYVLAASAALAGLATGVISRGGGA
jgi:hypothetical protein